MKRNSRSCDDLWVRFFCGAVLVATYCRARWGDLMRAERVIESLRTRTNKDSCFTLRPAQVGTKP